MVKEIVISRPDDWHLHLRDGDFLPITVNETAKSFARAIIMPNLVPPVTKLTHVKNYKKRIKKRGQTKTPRRGQQLSEENCPA